MHLRGATQRVAVLRLVLLAATERTEARIELLAAMALRERDPVPGDVETQRMRLRMGFGAHAPAARLPRAEPRHEVIRNVGQGGTCQQAPQVGGRLDLSRVRTQF